MWPTSLIGWYAECPLLAKFQLFMNGSNDDY